MALLHRAQLTPSKLELVGGWIADQPFWQAGADPATLERVASFRFDDPAGEVGIETLIVRAGDTTLQVPLTYRAAPLPGGEASLIGTMEHSVLGTRYAYDAIGDPVYLAEAARVAATGGAEVEQYYEQDGERRIKPGDAHVRGNGHQDAAVPAVPVDAVAITVDSDPFASVARWSGGSLAVSRDLGAAPSEEFSAAPLRIVGDWADMHDVLVIAVSPDTRAA
ncbi:maltokinase N-terminal cap-like domain-containing protein [Humibacter ginsenosidimutans]|uniref:Maltokinase N-terminal cap domain-containing protein n=1 Tax=Humibacter ginsenosidimutans TaxID=2599293 RepID=A0A5B8M2N9_9MICO|nr:hypothetical protein [Humibacter ginsenosidimutans]QDZ14613.1 hypothetical protein FPZ11_07460 [Humibacter ginsenosidimutans]